jgi:hypothetical protein
MSVFTNAGEFRKGKGNRKSRLAPRTSAYEMSKRAGTTKVSTPNSIAVQKLMNLFKSTDISIPARNNYKTLFLGGEQTRFMNMDVLAKVLDFLTKNGNDMSPENINYDAMETYIDAILSKKNINETPNKPISQQELEIMKIRMAATFIRYIRYYNDLRRSRNIENETLVEEPTEDTV